MYHNQMMIMLMTTHRTMENINIVERILLWKVKGKLSIYTSL